MSSALSPTTVASSKDAPPPTGKQITDHIKYYQQTHKAIVTFTALVNRLPPGQALKIGKHSIRRCDVNQYSNAYMSQLRDIKRMVMNNRKKRNKRTNSQLNSLFYVSDQLVSFYKGAKLGPSDPSSSRSAKLSSSIDIITKKHMTTSGILTSLISRYIDANNLKTPGVSGRFQPDDRMKEYLEDTVYTLFGEDISDRELPRELSQEKRDKIISNIGEGSKSPFSRVEGRMDKRSNTKVYDKKNGLLYTTMMVFNNFYRVPSSLLTDEEKEELQNPDNIEMAKTLQVKLSKITEWNHKK